MFHFNLNEKNCQLASPQALNATLKNGFGITYISEPIFYGDLVYEFKRIVGKPNFSDQFKKIVKRYIRVGYNLDIMRQSACLVLNPITVIAMVSSLIARRWVRPQTL